MNEHTCTSYPAICSIIQQYNSVVFSVVLFHRILQISLQCSTHSPKPVLLHQLYTEGYKFCKEIYYKLLWVTKHKEYWCFFTKRSRGKWIFGIIHCEASQRKNQFIFLFCVLPCIHVGLEGKQLKSAQFWTINGIYWDRHITHMNEQQYPDQIK